MSNEMLPLRLGARNDRGYRPDRILVEHAARNDEATHEILAKLPGITVQSVADVEAVLPELKRSSDPHGSGKRCLVLARHKGRFMKDCPGAGAEVCCNYYVVNFGSNCPLECTYCFLQSYLNHPAMMIFTNLEELLAEIRFKLSQAPHRLFRIGTGELADSLALDGITGFSRHLVPFFGKLANGILELKTKSDQIANLEGLDHRDRTIVSWSMNTPEIVATEELKTASFEQRLSAAKQCQEWGYRIGFHFDPLIYYDDWESDYRMAVESTFSRVDASRVAWVSLGALRFNNRLRDIVRRRFPKSRVPYGEFVPGNHGKMRYFRPIRQEMYSKMRQWIENVAPQAFVFLCMENRASWENGLSTITPTTQGLSNQLDALVQIQN